MFTKSLQELARRYFDAGVFRDKSHPAATQRGKERGFMLKLHESNPDAPLSPFYLNLRTPDNPKPGPLTPDLVRATALELWNLARIYGCYCDCVVGLPNAGDPFAAALVDTFDKHGEPKGLLRMEKEVLANKRRVTRLTETPTSGSRVLVVDDLITKADTKMEGITVLRESELVVNDVLVIVDRQQGGAEELASAGVRLHSLFPLTHLLGLYVDECRITAASRDEILKYIYSS